MSHTWVVVANNSRARVFAADTDDDSFVEVHDLVHPESRLHEQHLTSDLPGRSADGTGQSRHAMDTTERPKAHEARTFAREVADLLEAGRTDNEYDKLLLVAAPEFLGRLRDCLDAPTRALVGDEIAKNVVTLPARDIHARVVERIA